MALKKTACDSFATAIEVLTNYLVLSQNNISSEQERKPSLLCIMGKVLSTV